jgi:hypothetical protein
MSTRHGLGRCHSVDRWDVKVIAMPKLISLIRKEAPGIDVTVRPMTDAKAAVASLERGDVDAYRRPPITVHEPPFDVLSFSIDLVHVRKSAEEPALRWLIDAVDRALR